MKKEKKYFKVISPRPMDVGGAWHKLMRVKDFYDVEINIDPTVESRTKGEGGILEWIVPDTVYNRDYIERVYHEYKTEEVMKTDKGFEKKKPVSQLKSKVMEELDAIGVTYPETATLKELESLLKKAKKVKAELEFGFESKFESKEEEKPRSEGRAKFIAK